MSRLVSFILLMAILLAIAAMSYQVVARFLLPMFLALLLVIMFRPLHQWFQARCGGRDRVAAGLTTITILVIVLGPATLVAVRAANEALDLASTLDQRELQFRFNQLKAKLPLTIPPKELEAKLEAMTAILDRLDPTSDELAAQGVAVQLAARREAVGELERLSREAVPLVKQIAARVPGGGGELAPAEVAWQRWTEALARLRAAVDPPPAAEPAPPAASPPAATAAAASPPAAPPADFIEEYLPALEAFRAARDELVGAPLVNWLRKQFDLDETRVTALRTQIQEMAAPLAVDTTQALGGLLINLILGLVVFIVSLYYFIADGPDMIATSMRLSPLDDRYLRQLLQEFSTISRAVVVATLSAALVQGALAGIGYFVCGFQSVFLLTVLTTLLALVPFVGAASVWSVCALWLFFEGHTTAAIGLAIYGACIVSTADNVIKPLVLHGQSNLHPLMALLSVLGGAQALGPIGIFVGPMVMAFLHATLVIVRHELKTFDTRAPEHGLQG